MNRLGDFYHLGYFGKHPTRYFWPKISRLDEVTRVAHGINILDNFWAILQQWGYFYCKHLVSLNMEQREFINISNMYSNEVNINVYSEGLTE